MVHDFNTIYVSILQPTVMPLYIYITIEHLIEGNKGIFLWIGNFR